MEERISPGDREGSTKDDRRCRLRNDCFVEHGQVSVNDEKNLKKEGSISVEALFL